MPPRETGLCRDLAWIQWRVLPLLPNSSGSRSSRVHSRRSTSLAKAVFTFSGMIMEYIQYRRREYREEFITLARPRMVSLCMGHT